MDLHNKGVIDSGCSRHKTGNMSYLINYENIDGGYVAFGGSPKGGKIIGKCTIKTGNLDFKNVYFDETSGILESFITGIENLVYHKVKVIGCGNENEFKNREMNQFFEMNEAVNIACYMQNRVLVVKPHNKTPYELVHGRTPTLSFMRPFRYPVTILNTKDHLGKFDGNANEGFFVGYSMNSLAFRVFNSRTRIVEENLHIRFSKNIPNVIGSGPDWLFDIEALTRTMNYNPIVAGTQSNDFADPKSSQDDGFKPLSDDRKKVDEDPSKGTECNDQEKLMNVNSTNNVNTISLTVNDAGINKDNKLSFASNMPALEDVDTFDFSNKDEDDYAVAGMNNLDTIIQNLEEHGFVSTVHQRTNHKDLQTACLLAFYHENICIEESKPDRGYAGRASTIQVTRRFEDLNFPNRVYKVEKHCMDYNKLLEPDDIIFGSTKKELCNAFERLMHEKFQMSSMRELTFFLVLKVKQKNDGIFICQDKYVAKMLKKFGFTEVKNVSTPMETQKPLLKVKDVCACARYQVNPKVSHLHAVKRIFRHIWSNVMAKTINEESQIHARVDGKEIIVTESSVRRDLQLADEEGVDFLPNSTVFENLELMGLVRYATTASSLEANLDSGCGPRYHKAMGDIIAQTRFENVSKLFNDSLLSRGNTLQSDEDRMKLNELMELCTNLQSRVFDLEKTKTTQALEITSLERRVKKLEKKQRSRTYKIKRLYKVGLTDRVDSSKDKQNLGEDASKQERIKAIDFDEDITLVNDQDDAKMFDVADLQGEDCLLKNKLLIKRLQVEEQQEFTDEEKATLFMQILEKRRKFFAAKRAKEKRKKPPTQAQQRKIMCTYLKNMEVKKLEDLKNKSFDSIQNMFDRAFKRVNIFIDFRTELDEGRLKRVGEELTQESAKKQKMEDDKETVELKQLMEIIPDGEEERIVRIKSHLNAIEVNTAQLELLLLEEFVNTTAQVEVSAAQEI
uniref:Retrovirus-related Pol polyprotein from transposon TNT 1-94 n=1 Tax=Tanacetum cinerariifolium TaxID=118510 RepID=A0A6L2L0S5_TANCI|nr:retrovirus-related Pol polyprotein from transposon TNT 1-94 [Tanacetum cinerariifolium]